VKKEPAIWFPTIRTGTGTDVFTERLVEGLQKQGIQAEITWLPLRAEYLPWTVPIRKPPKWATVVHVNTWLHSRFLPENLPIIATLHHSIHDSALRPYKGWLRAMYHQYWIAPNERRVMQRATQVTAVSQFVADMAKKTLCDVPMQVIYNGIDTELFCPSSRVRQENQPFRLLYVGSWMKRKGVDLLAPIMHELGNGFELHYTGGVASEKDKLSMPSNMHDLGKLNQRAVIQAMQNSDALLFPTRSEGFGLVAVEAMACGLPVITTKGTCLEELIIHGSNGYLCEPENIQAFVTSIRKTQSGRIERYLDKTRLSEFSIKTMLTEYSRLYQTTTLNFTLTKV